jgi:hypothetical protein
MAKKVVTVVGCVMAYVAGTYMAYNWFQTPKVHSPSPSNIIFDSLAADYDKKMERDEWLLGIINLRKQCT